MTTDPTDVDAPLPDELLADALAAADDLPSTQDEQDTRDQPFVVDGPRTADWAVQKIRAADARYAAETATVQDRIRWHEEQLAELHEYVAVRQQTRDRTVTFMQSLLTAWLRRTRQQEAATAVPEAKRTTSLPLPGGTVRSRKGQDRVDVTNPEAVYRWMLRENRAGSDVAGIATRGVTVSRKLLKAWITGTGQVPAGVEVTPATDDDRSVWVDLA